MRLLSLLAAWAVFGSAYADDWLPVTGEELQMRSEPKAPKVPAIYLYRQVDRDDEDSSETIYVRIKVLTEEGRKYGDVELSYLKDEESIRNIRARTIRADGSIAEFDGKVYEKQLVKARGVKLMAKTFTLPDVQVGSILEYRYRHYMNPRFVFNSRWLLSESLFTRHAKFTLRPNSYFPMRWSWPRGLPENTGVPKKERGLIRLETRDVPAFVSEDYMPPEDVMKFRVEFIYEDDGGQREQVKYWKSFGKRSNLRLEKFIGSRRTMEAAVAQIVQAGDAPEIKLRKIYARAQQMRNLSFERDKSEQETQREKLADVRDAEDIWTRGYGDGIEITWLCLALARAAGLEADAVLVPTRDRYFFDPPFMNSAQLNSNALLVKLDGKEIWLDPGTPFTPFGMLPWAETAVTGLKLDKTGGTWATTPVSAPSASRIERVANLKLDKSGSLEGKLVVKYTGLEASWRRMTERNEDETDRRQFLEQDVSDDVPSGVEVKLTNSPDWGGSDAPLVAEYDLKIPGWAASAGRRALVPVGLFGGAQKHMFEHASRVHPLYFNHPYQHTDDVTIELPAGWKVASVPKPRPRDLKTVTYSMDAREADGSLRLKRDLMLNLTLVNVKFYPAMRDFFQNVRAGDEDQAVLVPVAGAQ